MNNDLNNNKYPLAAALYNANAKFLRRVAYRLTGNYDLANDLVQTLFDKLLQNYSKVEKHQNIEGWLFVTMRHICYNLDSRRDT